jgi:hypothetical protein
MDRVPALFAGTVFGCFGAALLLWTAARLRHRLPVTAAGGTGAAAVSLLFGTAALAAGVWCLTQV